jgi:YihY family inner membrane protein
LFGGSNGHHRLMRFVSNLHASVDRWQQRHAVTGFLFAVRQKYDEDQGRYLAATITYYAFLSIFPLLLVLVTLLGYALEGDSDLQARVLDSALADFPVIGDQLQANVHSLQGSVPALVIGIAVAIWAGTGVCLAIENAMDHIWGVPFRRRANPVLARVRALLWIALLGGVVIVDTFLGGLSTSATSYDLGLRLLALAASLVINCVVFLTAFRVLTSASPSVRQVLPGAIFAAIAWAILQALGGYLVHRYLRNASATYGTFALVLGLLAWLQLAASMTLLSAEMNVVAARRLWPRSLMLFAEEPLAEADEDALRQRAEIEERRSDQEVHVSFDPPEEADA